MGIRPSQTQEGQSWLANFAAYDQPTAQLLLDSLRFVSMSAIQTGLAMKLESLAKDGLDGPTALIAERPMAEFDIAQERREAPVAYVDFQPGEETAVTSGSVGFIGGIIRDLPGIRRPRPNSKWIAPTARIEEIRDRRCRSLLIVTDYSGSGGRVVELAEALQRNTTIHSWRSLRYLDIDVLAYAMSPVAEAALKDCPYIRNVWSVEAAPSLETDQWPAAVREQITNLCLTEGRVRRDLRLGYGGSGGLFVSARGAPNNLPAVFLQTVGSWEPLFPDRVVPPRFAEAVGDYRPGQSLEQLAENVGQLRLGRNVRLRNMRPASRTMLAGLLLVSKRRLTPVRLAAALSISVEDADALLSFLSDLGFVEGGWITDAGRREISANKAGLRWTTAGLAGSDDVYYPTSLR